MNVCGPPTRKLDGAQEKSPAPSWCDAWPACSRTTLGAGNGCWHCWHWGSYYLQVRLCCCPCPSGRRKVVHRTQLHSPSVFTVSSAGCPFPASATTCLSLPRVLKHLQEPALLALLFPHHLSTCFLISPLYLWAAWKQNYRFTPSKPSVNFFSYVGGSEKHEGQRLTFAGLV